MKYCYNNYLKNKLPDIKGFFQFLPFALFACSFKVHQRISLPLFSAILAVIVKLALPVTVSAQEVIPLYFGTIPNSTGYKMTEVPEKWKEFVIGIRNVSNPSLTVYQPAKETATRAAVIICPGGGYRFENDRAEGKRIAEAFTKYGITAFVLKYRLPSDSIMQDKSIGPLQDAQQAIKLVRERSKEWNIDADKIGIIGFSAGGHLASTAATHFSTAYIPNTEGTGLRPDFAILVYPVISFRKGLMHSGSKDLLLGMEPSNDKIKLFSNELQVTPQTPPTWLTHAGDDTVVSVDNSIQFYEALMKNKVPA